MQEKKMIMFIYKYHPLLFLFEKEVNYYFGPCIAMIESGWEVEIISYGNNVKIENDPNYDNRIKIRYYKNPISTLWYIRKNRNIFIYSNSLHIISLLIGLIGNKTLFFPHQSIFPSKYTAHSFIKKIIVSFFYKYFSKIRTINNYEIKLLKENNNNNGVCIPLAINLKLLNKNLSNNINILLLGRVTQFKDPITILKALQLVVDKYPQIKIYQIGNSTDFIDEKGNNYSENIKYFGLTENIELLGELPQNKFPKLNTSIYINSSYMEGQCLAAYEASLLGNALCLPNIPSFKEVFSDEVLLHEIGDYLQLSNNIIRYIEHPLEKSKMISKNQKRILKNNSFENIQNQLKKEIGKLY